MSPVEQRVLLAAANSGLVKADEKGEWDAVVFGKFWGELQALLIEQCRQCPYYARKVLYDEARQKSKDRDKYLRYGRLALKALVCFGLGLLVAFIFKL